MNYQLFFTVLWYVGVYLGLAMLLGKFLSDMINEDEYYDPPQETHTKLMNNRDSEHLSSADDGGK